MTAPDDVVTRKLFALTAATRPESLTAVAPVRLFVRPARGDTKTSLAATVALSLTWLVRTPTVRPGRTDDNDGARTVGSTKLVAEFTRTEIDWVPTCSTNLLALTAPAVPNREFVFVAAASVAAPTWEFVFRDAA